MIMQFALAAIGTIAFALLFSVPKQYYPYCGIVGGTGWIVYVLLTKLAAMSPTVSTFIATLFVIFLSRTFAVMKKCPATVFLIAGIFPLVPGAGVYWTSYYLVTSQVSLALTTGLAALKAAIAIVLGIVVVFELPYKLFRFAQPKEK